VIKDEKIAIWNVLHDSIEVEDDELDYDDYDEPDHEGFDNPQQEYWYSH